MIFHYDCSNRRDSSTIEHLNFDGPFHWSDGLQADDIVICCGSCNSSHGLKKLAEWFKTQYCIEKNINAETVAEPVKSYLGRRSKTDTGNGGETISTTISTATPNGNKSVDEYSAHLTKRQLTAQLPFVATALKLGWEPLASNERARAIFHYTDGKTALRVDWFKNDPVEYSVGNDHTKLESRAIDLLEAAYRNRLVSEALEQTCEKLSHIAV